MDGLPDLRRLPRRVYRSENCQGGCTEVRSSSSNLTGSPHDFPHYVEKSGFTVTKTYPKAPSVGVPEPLPDNVSRFFIQAKGCLQRRDFDAAGMMCRKALEATIKENPYYRFVAGDKIAMGEAAQRGYLLFKDPVKATAKLATWASILRMRTTTTSASVWRPQAQPGLLRHHQAGRPQRRVQDPHSA